MVVVASGAARLDARGAAARGTHSRRRRSPPIPLLQLLLLLAAACGMAAHTFSTFIGVHAFLNGAAPGVPSHVIHTHVRPARPFSTAASSSRHHSGTISSGGARLSSGVLLQRASSGDGDGAGDGASAAALLVAEVRKMRAAAIKDELKSRGVPTAGIVDKEDLVALLVRSRQQQPQPQPPASASAASGGGGGGTAAAGGASKGYAAVRVPFRQRTPPTTLPGGGTTAQGPKSYICVDVTVRVCVLKGEWLGWWCDDECID